METGNTRAIILAAGRSTRFKTDKCKLLYTVCGQPMVLYPLNILQEMNIPITMIVGYQANEIKEEVAKANIKNVTFVTQEEQLGTGHAVECSKCIWDKDDILILNGDTPLLTKELIENLLEEHQSKKSTITFLSAHSLNPFGYGRIIRKDNKISIVEEKNCTEEQRDITLTNSGIYLINKKFLEENINKLEKNSVTGEYYITDIVDLANNLNLKVQTIPVSYDYVRGVNTLEELWAAEQIKRSEGMRHWMSRGVRFELAQSIHLDVDVEIGPGSFIGTGAHLLKGTKIGKNCNVNAFTIIENSIIGDGSHIHSHSVIQDSTVGENVHVGPFARLRKNAVLGDNANVGNFVEVKNSTIAENTSTKHLSYIGDAKVGKNVNIGAGTITCNYDGVKKHKTTIEDNSFIGSNNTLIAPIKVGKNSYTAAGSTINKDVPEDTLAIGRAKQENKIGYTKKETKQDKSSCKSKKKDNMNFNFIGAVKTDEIQK